MLLTNNDLINIFLPILSHWIIWLSFLAIVIIVLLLYAYPYLKKPRKEFLSYHIGAPIANVISFYIFTKMLEGVIYQGSILKVDASVNQAMFALQTPTMIKIATIITSFGTGILIYALLTVTIGILLLRKRWRYALLSIVAILGATLLQVVIKALVHRTRPPNLIETGFSFPSGHAITAIVYVALLIYSYKDDIKHPALKYALITAASAFFVTVGLTRIYLNVHWFSDVIAGMSLGLFWFMLVVLIERSITGLIQSVRRETKEAEPIKNTRLIKTAKKIISKK